MSSIKIYSDEHIRKQIVIALKSKGIDIVSTEDAKNKNKSDVEQIKFATSEGRVILTKDSDYLKFKDSLNHCGIFFVSKRKPDQEIVSNVLAILEVMDESDVRGVVIYI